MTRGIPPAAFLALGLLASLALFPADPTGAQPKGPTPPAAPTDIPPFSSFLSLPADPDLKKKLEAVQDYIKSEDWEQATRILQLVLDAKEDVFVPVRAKGPDGKEAVRWASARSEVNRLLATLPANGLEFYQLSFGPAAATLLDEARKKNDPELLAGVGQRYLHTQAGFEATTLLAAYHLDRGRHLMAALCYDRLLLHPRADSLPPISLFKAALAYHGAGDRDGAERAWKKLSARAPDGVAIGNKKVSLAELEKELAQYRAAAPAMDSLADWPMFRGNASRSARADGAAPVLEPRWQQPTVADGAVGAWLAAAAQRLEDRSQPALPAFFPIAVGDKVVYRSHRGVHAVERQTGKLLWESSVLGGLESLTADSRQLPHLSSWIEAYLSGDANVLLDNSLIGTLSSDGKQVYAVEDLPVPPFPSNYYGFTGRAGQGLQLSFAPQLTDALYHSRLVAIELETGKVAWEAGGRGAKKEGGEPLHDVYFLGPPLPLAGKLYVVAEKDQDLYAICLDPGTGAPAWSQKLAMPKTRLLLDGGRRLHAAPLAYGEGLLVCPTNAGALVAVDLLSHSLVWAHAYREEPVVNPPPAGRRPARPALPTGPPNLRPEWKASAPVIHDGKVVFAAPDEPSVQCLSLRDGSLVWKWKRGSEDDLYLAGVFDGAVLLVGKRGCRALGLKDGKELWKVETGPPSGQGIASGKVYYLPVKGAGRDKEAGVVAIDLDKGVVRDRTPAPKGDALGNLVLLHGEVISQTATGLTVYPHKKE